MVSVQLRAPGGAESSVLSGVGPLSCYGPFAQSSVKVIAREVHVQVEGAWQRWSYGSVARSLADDIRIALALDAEQQARNASQRRKGLNRAMDRMIARHLGEGLRWARFSMPGEDGKGRLLAAWTSYCRWWQRNHGAMDYQAVLDRGPHGEHVWHLHVAYFGAFVDQVELAAAWCRCGGPEFVYVRTVREGQARLYLRKRLVGYLDAKSQGRRMARKWAA